MMERTDCESSDDATDCELDPLPDIKVNGSVSEREDASNDGKEAVRLDGSLQQQLLDKSLTTISSDSSIFKSDPKQFKNEETGEWTCPVCDTILESQHAFTQHIRQHNPTDHSHTCSICGKTLSSASSLDRHMLIHSGERPFKCRICLMAFTTNGNMHRHMRTHGTDKTVSSSEAADSDPNNNRFAKTKKRKAPPASDHHIKSPTLASSPKRRATAASNAVTIAADEEQRDQHQRTSDRASIALLPEHHPASGGFFDASSPKFGMTPPIKNFGFYDLSFTDFSSNKFSMIAKSFCESNMRKSSSAYHDFQCTTCKRAFPCSSALAMHNCSKTYCDVCKRDLGSSMALRSHQVKHRLEETLAMKRIVAPSFNGRSLLSNLKNNHLTDKEGFMAMLQLFNKEDVSAAGDENVDGEEAFDNPSYYVNARPLSPNKVDSNNQSSDSSDVSNGDLADIQSIISVTCAGNHLNEMRSSPRAASPASPLDDSDTGPNKPASSASAAPAGANDMSEVNSSKISTSDNGLSDSSKDDLKDVKDADLFKCTVCPQSFKTFNALKRHNRSHNQASHSHACHLCSYTSLDKSTLVRHLRTHNGERPFQCRVCSYKFTTKSNCERHVRKRHKKMNKVDIQTLVQYNSEMGSDNNKTPTHSASESLDSLTPTNDIISNSDTVCKYCNEDFKFNRLLRHHLRSQHNSCNLKPYCCVICKLGFSTKNNCYRHIRKQHPEVEDKLNAVVTNDELPFERDTESSKSFLQGQMRDSIGDQASVLQTTPQLAQNDQLTLMFKNFLSNKSIYNLSLEALCQVAENALNDPRPLNLSAKPESNSLDSFDGQACDLSLNKRVSKHVEHPLDLAMHPLDLSVKSNAKN